MTDGPPGEEMEAIIADLVRPGCSRWAPTPMRAQVATLMAMPSAEDAFATSNALLDAAAAT